jgi:pilus assembly protein CpaE
MQALIVSDHEPISGQVRQALLPAGYEVQVASLDRVPGALARDVSLLVVVLSPDPERALKDLGELRGQTQARVLAIGPTYDPKLMLRALRAGADDFLDELEISSELEAALSRRRRAEQPAQPTADLGKVTAVLGSSGGCGASTVAANVATVLARQHKRAGLIDLKLEAGDLAALLDLKPNHTLADLCQSGARMDRVMLERSFVQHSSGVHLLAPPRSFADIASVTPDGVRRTLGLARSLFPYVVVDLDHPSRPEQLQALQMAEVVVVVLRLDFTSLRNTRRALDYLEQLGITADRIQLVVNRYGQAKEIPYAKAEEALGRKIPHYVPDDPRTVNRANNSGVPVVLESPSAKVSRTITALAASVNGRHKGSHP